MINVMQVPGDDNSSINELPLVQIRENNNSTFIQNQSIATDQTDQCIAGFRLSNIKSAQAMNTNNTNH